MFVHVRIIWVFYVYNISMKNFKKIELLAPAGNMEALNAAVCGGADSVYLGLDKFNARRGADNFNLSNLKLACDYAHLHSVRVFLTFNIIVFEEEFKSALNMAIQAANCGVDAFIVQDIGVAQYLSNYIPSVPVHISTQMNIHDVYGIDIAKNIGAKRITLARELSISQIKDICKRAKEENIEIETFAHGAICVCYSGQCLMSSMIGGRSANRGTCAQACRLNYQLINSNLNFDKKNLSLQEDKSSYLLSPKDLCTIEILPELLDAGVSSIKIEGRMKSCDYVYTVVSTYRKALNRLYEQGKENYYVDDEDLKSLKEVFSRGFSTAYMHNKRGNEIMSYKRPNNRGVNIGRVDYIDKNKIKIKCKCDLFSGDILEIWTKHGRCSLNVDSNTKMQDNFAIFQINKSFMDYKDVRISDRIFRLRSANQVFTSNTLTPKIPVYCNVQMLIGKPLYMSFSYNDHSVLVEGDIVEAAITKSISADDIKEHVGRCGQTPFFIDDIEVELDDGVGISFSKLHNLRKQGLKKLEDQILSSWKKKKQDINHPKKYQSTTIKDKFQPKVCAIVTNPENSHAVKKSGIDSIYVPLLNYKRGGALYSGKRRDEAGQTPYVKNCILMQGIINDSQMQDEKIVFCDNIASVFNALSKNIDIEIGPHIPVVNCASVKYFENLGVKRIWLSPELSFEQIKDITLCSNKVSFGLYVMGPTELMITKHCHLMSLGDCDQNCSKCNRRKTSHSLLDRKSYMFPVFTDNKGRGHIYNSIQLDLCHCLDDLIQAGIDSFMIDTTFMNAEDCAHAIGRAKKALTSSVEKSKNTTTGHLFRQVL